MEIRSIPFCQWHCYSTTPRTTISTELSHWSFHDFAGSFWIWVWWRFPGDNQFDGFLLFRLRLLAHTRIWFNFIDYRSGGRFQLFSIADEWLVWWMCDGWKGMRIWWSDPGRYKEMGAVVWTGLFLIPHRNSHVPRTHNTTTRMQCEFLLYFDRPRECHLFWLR